MTAKRQVYLLDPQKIPPETIAVAFAKTSRAPQSFREIAAELSVEKSAEFHEKWVVGYGHASVAEHAVLHIAVENISRLAVEVLEPKLGYLLMRMIWMVPLGPMVAWMAASLASWLSQRFEYSSKAVRLDTISAK